MSERLRNAILEAIKSEETEVLIQEFDFKTDKNNELLFFFKPGCFNVPDFRNTQAIIDMVMTKLSAYQASISGVLLLSGERLEELCIMDRHYGYINKLSKQASTILHDDDFQHIYENLEITSNFEKYSILGGHEFLQRFPSFDIERLRNLWITKHSHKLRSGFYIQEYDVDNQHVILVNGFHPSQLAFFTNPTHKIVLLLLHSDTNWHALKYDLVGETFPEKAQKESIRGELYAHHEAYGLPEVTVSNNMVHLSAGPFEGLFEIYNFLHEIPASNFALSATNMARLMREKELLEEDVTRCLSNPVAMIEGEEIDLFTATEDQNSEEAIAKYQQYFRKA